VLQVVVHLVDVAGELFDSAQIFERDAERNSIIDYIDNMDYTRDLQTPPLLQTTTFSQTLPWSVKYFMHGRKTFKTRHSVIQRRSGLIILRMRDAIVQSKSFAHVGPSDWTLPAPGITIPVTNPAAEMT